MDKEDSSSCIDFWKEFDLDKQKIFLNENMTGFKNIIGQILKTHDPIPIVEGKGEPSRYSYDFTKIRKLEFDLDKQRSFLNENMPGFLNILAQISKAPDPIPIVEEQKKKLSEFEMENGELKRKLDQCKGEKDPSRYSCDFTKIKRLGRGGYAKVFESKNNLDKRSYAVKMIPLSEDQRDKVLREVHILSGLTHKNVVRYYQAWIEDGEPDSSGSDNSVSEESNSNRECLFIQMELCKSTLSYQLEKEIDNKTSWECFKQLVEGVNYLHNKGIIHRDLSSLNVMLDDGMNIKICDFGLGNSIYRAPEMDQANSKINEKVDIFSLGIIFFEMLCHFKTGMERIKCIEALKEKKEFPKTWTGNEASEDFVLELISIAPGARPSTFEILNRHPWDVTER